MDTTRLLAIGGFLAALATGMYLRFNYDLTLPPMPPRPQPPPVTAIHDADYTPRMYQAYVAKDLEQFGARTAADELTRPFSYQDDAQPHPLEVGGPAFENGQLRLAARLERVPLMTSQGSITADQVVLRIENLTDRPLAYRVQTSTGYGMQACIGKADLSHNAIALRARQAVDRTECGARAEIKLVVEHVETMTLPELSFFYLSQLAPADIGLDLRTSRAHSPPVGRLCEHTPQSEIVGGLRAGTVTWRDVIDFYARHRCHTYGFPTGYRALTRPGQYNLPVSKRSVGL